MRLYDFLEHLISELFTLIVPNGANLNLLVMTEVVVVVHFACDKGISAFWKLHFQAGMSPLRHRELWSLSHDVATDWPVCTQRRKSV